MKLLTEMEKGGWAFGGPSFVTPSHQGFVGNDGTPPEPQEVEKGGGEMKIKLKLSPGEVADLKERVQKKGKGLTVEPDEDVEEKPKQEKALVLRKQFEYFNRSAEKDEEPLEKAAKRGPQPGQLSLDWDESEHPRHPAGSAQGGEFMKKDESEKPADPNVLHTFTNEEEGTKGVVARHTGVGGGFIVSYHDLEAGQDLGSYRIFPKEEDAIREAKKFVGQEHTGPDTPDDTKDREKVFTRQDGGTAGSSADEPIFSTEGQVDGQETAGGSFAANSTSGQSEEPSWTMGVARYLHLNHPSVYRPWIAEISPMAKAIEQDPMLLLKAKAVPTCPDCGSFLVGGEVQDGRCMGCQQAWEEGMGRERGAVPLGEHMVSTVPLDHNPTRTEVPAATQAFRAEPGLVLKGVRGKVEKASVHYSQGMKKRHCGNCEYFNKGGTCDRVKGEIAPNMWCDLWEKADGAERLEKTSSGSFAYANMSLEDESNITKEHYA